MQPTPNSSPELGANALGGIERAIDALVRATNPLIKVTPYTNGNTAGGTFYILQVGGFKVYVGLTNFLNTTGIGPKTFIVDIPAGTFQTVLSAQTNTAGVTTYAEQYAHISAFSTANVTVYLVNAGGAAAATARASVVVIGL